MYASCIVALLFVSATFACEDKSEYCPHWKESGYCESNPATMIRDCQKTCNFCDEGPCRDVDAADCRLRAGRGECESNIGHMGRSCRATCRFCKLPQGKVDPDCVDVRENCEQFAEAGWCESKAQTLLLTCKKTCRNCDFGKCEDQREDCEERADKGECDSNSQLMLRECKRACYACDKGNKPDVRGFPKDDLTIPPGPCKDNHVNCEEWSQRWVSECTSNSGWMLKNCRKACGNCNNERFGGPGKCMDQMVTCLTYASDGACNLGGMKEIMKIRCPYSCGHCKGCRDFDEGICQTWVQRGKCRTDPMWIGKFCPKSCGRC